MAYTTTIYDPQEGLETIGRAIEKFDDKRFLFALNYKDWDETEIELMARQVCEYRTKLEQEHIRLIEFAKTFNKEFVTDNNRCFDTGLKLIRKLRSGISEVKRIYQKFCPRAPKQRFYYKAISNKKQSAFDYSYLSIGSYQLSLFPLDSEIYPPCVRGLYNELGRFFHQLSLSLALCMKVLQDEEKIRKDSEYCNFLFEKFKREVMKEIMDMIMLMPTDADIFQEEHNPAIASLKKYSGTEAWAPQGFHNFTKKDVKHLIIKEAQEFEKNGNISKEQFVLFGNNSEMIAKIDNVILHFDELMPDDYKRKKLDAAIIALFMRWCGVTDEEHFIAYFNKVYKRNPSRQHETVKKGAVNSAKNKQVRENNNIEYNEFVQKLEKLHFIPAIQHKQIANS